MSGTIIDRRDHVRITFFVPASFCLSTFWSRCSSTKGPFLRLRGIFLNSYLLYFERFLLDGRRRTMSLSDSFFGFRVLPSG